MDNLNADFMCQWLDKLFYSFNVVTSLHEKIHSSRKTKSFVYLSFSDIPSGSVLYF